MKYPARMFVYKAADGWRWRLKACNGNITGDSGQAYGKRSHADAAARAFAATEIVMAETEEKLR